MSKWLGAREVVKPKAPASMLSRNAARMALISFSVAARSNDSAPMVLYRSVEWPTMVTTLRPSPASRASMYSPKETQDHGSSVRKSSRGISSTLANIRIRYSRSSGLHGARL